MDADDRLVIALEYAESVRELASEEGIESYQGITAPVALADEVYRLQALVEAQNRELAELRKLPSRAPDRAARGCVMHLRWSWDVKRLRIYMNWIFPTSMRILRGNGRR